MLSCNYMHQKIKYFEIGDESGFCLTIAAYFISVLCYTHLAVLSLIYSLLFFLNVDSCEIFSIIFFILFILFVICFIQLNALVKSDYQYSLLYIWKLMTFVIRIGCTCKTNIKYVLDTKDQTKIYNVTDRLSTHIFGVCILHELKKETK